MASAIEHKIKINPKWFTFWSLIAHISSTCVLNDCLHSTHCKSISSPVLEASSFLFFALLVPAFVNFPQVGHLATSFIILDFQIVRFKNETKAFKFHCL